MVAKCANRYRFDLGLSSLNYSSFNDFHSVNNEFERGIQTSAVPPIGTIYDMNYPHDREDVECMESQNYSSELPPPPQNSSTCNSWLGWVDQARNNLQLGRYRRYASNPASFVPDFGTSGATQSSGLRLSEIAEGSLPLSSGSVVDAMSAVGSGNSWSYLNQQAKLQTELCDPSDQRSLPGTKNYDDGSEDLSSHCDDYEIPVPHKLEDDPLARYDSQLVDVWVEQQGTQTLNDEPQGLDGVQIPPEFVDEGTSQPTATPHEPVGDIQQMPAQKSCWHCRIKHERVVRRRDTL
ncbi:hypothetical protein ACJ72_05433 [Emergomyces africanus]|uniref:Uncharacterized protein n=1 Tax=Emergomyces africanus TaxID=1955775 RepID=A0A1B7NU26_9EURO|nr:hypothetical protein ACJ72_05433 [Emergomyces africanus]